MASTVRRPDRITLPVKRGHSGLRFRPLTLERWPDLERLFGTRGACGGCWCMWWRLRRSEFQQRKGAANKRAFRQIVESGTVPGILAYDGTEPVGWCAIEPRTPHYTALKPSTHDEAGGRPAGLVGDVLLHRIPSAPAGCERQAA